LSWSSEHLLKVPGHRLLILDGLDAHVQVEFLKECWAQNIVVLVIPAHLLARLQPLNVNFFNPLKAVYHDQIEEYMLGSDAGRVTKAFFYRWFQQSWSKTASRHNIQSAWSGAGLYPIKELRDCVRALTPDREIPCIEPETPHNTCMQQAINRQLCRGEISPSTAYRKTSKALEKAWAERVVIEKDLEKRQAADKLDKEAKGGGKSTRFPQGQLFDQQYQEEHAGELEERRGREKEGCAKKKAAAGAKGKEKAPAPGEQSQAGPSGTVREE
jgi:hypothetical protein